MERGRAGIVVLAWLAVLCLPVAAAAHAPSGAIFTTLFDGSEVNFNHYPSKEAVYLDGGPGVGAPQDAAGLDDGTYVFQVTDPSGKVLLSTDPAECRTFTVSGGVISSVGPSSCPHATGFDMDHGAVTVQLFPYLDTPNNGGVYKVWVTQLDDFLLGCQALGHPGTSGLSIVDCGNAPGNRHGFIPRHSKTDNFKVRQDGPVVEIDTYFVKRGTLEPLDGRRIEWTDPVGASNRKWSYYAPSLQVGHEAHIEAVETGTHLITVPDQVGCDVSDVTYDNRTWSGPTTVEVDVRSIRREWAAVLWVVCN